PLPYHLLDRLYRGRILSPSVYLPHLLPEEYPSIPRSPQLRLVLPTFHLPSWGPTFRACRLVSAPPPFGFSFLSPCTYLTDLVLHHGGVWNVGTWSLRSFPFTCGRVSFKGRFLPPLVLPLPDLTPGPPVTACSLLAGRLVGTFTHGIALLPWVGYRLSWPVGMLGGLVRFRLLGLGAGRNEFVRYLGLLLA